MNADEIEAALTNTAEDLDVIIDMVMDRDQGDALRLVTMLHEIAKLYVADQLPKAHSVNHYQIPAEREHLEVLFAGRNVRTAQNLIKHLNLVVDDDGIPL